MAMNSAEHSSERADGPVDPTSSGQANTAGVPSVRRALGMMVGGALGDALGGVVEFASIEAIRARYGRDGIIDLPGTLTDLALITDDTQIEVPPTATTVAA